MAVHHAGWFVQAGLYYSLDNGDFARVPQGGGLLAGRDGAIFLRLPAWSKVPVAAIGAGVFHIALPLLLLGAITIALCLQLGRGLCTAWVAGLRLAGLHPKPSVSNLVAGSLCQKGDWLDELEATLLCEHGPGRQGCLANLRRRFNERRR